MSNLNDALMKMEATEANVQKLLRIWEQIEVMLKVVKTSGVIQGIEDESAYKQLERNFEHIRQVMPKIDGFELTNEIQPADTIIHNLIDLAELGEISATISYDSQLWKQRDVLSEYDFRLRSKRRQLARREVESNCEQIDSMLPKLLEMTTKFLSNANMPEEFWNELKKKVTTIDALLGEKLARPARWDMLRRHIAFGMRGDLDDIIQMDWPAVRGGLQAILYGEEDPLPVEVDDIGSLVNKQPKGPIATELKWDKLDDQLFERLIYNLISNTTGYENPEWLTHINAPDRGRDLSVFRSKHDHLATSRRERIIIQCKHKKSVNVADISTTESQMALWAPPRVDELIIATSGRFTTDAVQWVEKHNQADKALHIEIWPNSHLEMLLARRPELIAQFHLR